MPVRRPGVAVAVAAVLLATVGSTAASPSSRGAHPCRADWPMYGHDLAHTFSEPAGCSAITPSTVATLVPAWFFHTKDSITASPAVSHGVVYVGSWDGTFYAVGAKSGTLQWKYRITSKDVSAFGRIVSSASVVTAGRGPLRRRVVIFGGGSSVWVLDALTGKKLAAINLDPRTEADRRKAPRSPTVEVESSPSVVPDGRGGDRIYVGFDVHDEAHVGRTGLVGLTLIPGQTWRLRPDWKYDVDRNRTWHGRAGLTRGSGTGLGCGGVWGSPAVDPTRDEVVFGTAACDYAPQAWASHVNYSEELVALHAASGKLLWRWRPESGLPKSKRVAAAETDADFGASAQLFTLPNGKRVVGIGRKNAVYYVRTERAGHRVSRTVAGQPGLLNPNFAVGGFIGSTAVQLDSKGRAMRVIGGTAIPLPLDPTVDALNKTFWDVRALNPQTGKLDWIYRLGTPTYAATSVVNGVAFVPETVQSAVVALNAATGAPLWLGPVVGPPSSAAVVAGDSLYLGTGTRETDLEYKAVSDQLQNTFKNFLGESPLSPISGIQAFRLAKDVL